MTEEKRVSPYQKHSTEDMEREIEYKTLYDPGEEFPIDDVKKSITQLNMDDQYLGYHYDHASSAEA